MKSRRNLTRLVIALFLVQQGCQNIDSKRSYLYKETTKDNNLIYNRPAHKDDLYYGGNVVFIPEETIVTFSPELLSVGWLANPYWENAQSDKRPADRIFPEKSLWLVINIEGFASDDFLRTASKRTFIASAVKQDQLSNSLLALDPSEMRFNIKSSDYKQHEVTIALYQVDNFKMKKLIGAIRKDNEGLIKIGYDAGSAAMTKVLGVVADPFWETIKGLQRRHGSEFMFERLLLGSGATKEFEGMIYLITSASKQIADTKKPSRGKTITPERYLLIDPTQLVKTSPGQESKSTYSELLTHVNKPIPDSTLKTYSDYLLLNLDYTVDNNAKDIALGSLRQELANKQEARDKELERIVRSNYENLRTEINAYKEAAENMLKSIEDQALSTHLLTAMAAYAQKADTTSIANLNVALNQDSATDRNYAAEFEKLKARWTVDFESSSTGRFSMKKKNGVKLYISNNDNAVPALTEDSLRNFLRAISINVESVSRKIKELERFGTMSLGEDVDEFVKSRILSLDDIKAPIKSTNADANTTISAAIERVYKAIDHIDTAKLRELTEAVNSLQKSLDKAEAAEGTATTSRAA